MENEEKRIHSIDGLTPGLHIMSQEVDKFIKDLYQILLDNYNKLTSSDKEVNHDK